MIKKVILTMFYSKKGVSPIIATVLLVAITIAIGATTMAFIRSLSDTNIDKSKQNLDSIACGAEVNFEVVILNNTYRQCHDNVSREFEVLLKSKGPADIKGFQMTVIANNASVKTIIYDNAPYTLPDKEYSLLTFSYNSSGFPSTDVSKFIISPRITSSSGKGVITCGDVVLEREAVDLAAC